jgi:hypothetical protein
LFIVIFPEHRAVAVHRHLRALSSSSSRGRTSSSRWRDHLYPLRHDEGGWIRIGIPGAHGRVWLVHLLAALRFLDHACFSGISMLFQTLLWVCLVCSVISFLFISYVYFCYKIYVMSACFIGSVKLFHTLLSVCFNSYVMLFHMLSHVYCCYEIYVLSYCYASFILLSCFK